MSLYLLKIEQKIDCFEGSVLQVNYGLTGRDDHWMDESEVKRLQKIIRHSYCNSPHKRKYWLALLEMYGKGKDSVEIGGAAVNPVRRAVPASRKPVAAARGGESNPCVRPLGPAESASLRLAPRPTPARSGSRRPA